MDPQQNELLSNLKQQWEITADQFRFGDYGITIWRPADPECVLDNETLLQPGKEMQWQPYWAQAWDASVGMARYLAGQDLVAVNVLDVGCGIGLTSALLAAAGANLTCGDNAPPALPFAEINTWPWRDRTRVQLIDWHKTNLDTRFDLIVGSDIVYDRNEVPPLNRFFRTHLAAQGSVLLGDPNRPMTQEYFGIFEDLGWQFLQRELVNVPNLRNPIRIVRITPG